MASCAEEAAQPVKTKSALDVYLAAEQVGVSSFDASPNWAPPQDSQALVDGSLLTRWSSNYTDNQWVSLDFGQPKLITKVVIFWEAAFAPDYDILVSDNNQSWQLVRSLKNQDGDVDELEIAPTKARYLKVMGKKRFNTSWGISIWELLCLGPANENPQDQPLMAVYPQLANRLTESGPVDRAIEIEIEKAEPSPGALTMEECQKGAVYTSWGTTELGSAASDKTLEYMRKLGVRHLGIMVVWYQKTIEENEILPDPKDTPEDKALVHAINTAHSLGMKVTLKPHVDIYTDEWRGDIIPSEAWWASYRKFILRYLRLAEQYNVESFSIGTELVNVTMPKWLSHWSDLIREARAAFSGKLTYSANWDEYETVGFWSDLDYVGIDAYFPLTSQEDPPKEELLSAWQSHAQAIDRWITLIPRGRWVVLSSISRSTRDGLVKVSVYSQRMSSSE